MCVIICIEKGQIPSLQTLKDAQSWNDDGAGLAYVKEGKVFYKKGLELKAEEIHEILKTEKPKTAIIHFRIKSSGEKISELNHPFPVSAHAELSLSGVADKVLFHNGTWYSHDDKLQTAFFSGRITEIPDGPFSDSRTMALLCHYYGDSMFKLLNNQKVAILTPQGIKRLGDGWVKVKNNHCSNDSFIKKETEAHLVKPSWCDEHKTFNCKAIAHGTPKLIAPNADIDAKIEGLWIQYSLEKDPKAAAAIMDRIVALEEQQSGTNLLDDFNDQMAAMHKMYFP